MSKQPKLLNRTIIGSKQDLMAAIAELPGDLDGLEEDYVMNV